MSIIYRVLGKKGRITIPFEIRQQLGVKYNDILSFEVENNKVIVTKEKLCNNCKDKKLDENSSSISEIINSFSPLQQYELFNQLAARWASGQMG